VKVETSKRDTLRVALLLVLHDDSKPQFKRLGKAWEKDILGKKALIVPSRLPMSK
jgi:hypothetical protein